MKIRSIMIGRYKYRRNVFMPPNDSAVGIRIEADSSISENEIWFVTPDVIHKIKISDSELLEGAE